MEDLSLLAVLLIVLSFLFLSAGCTSDLDPRMFSSHITYEFEIQITDQITNATFYIPLPVKNNVPRIGMVILNENLFEKNNFSVDLVQTIPYLNLSGTYAIQNNRSWFLKIHSDRINSDETNKTVYKIFIDNLTSPHTPLSFVDTINPINNESVFLPKLDFSPATPIMINQTFSHKIEYSSVEEPQKIPIYADYSASQSTSVYVYSMLNVDNSWKEYQDSGGYNYYLDSYYWRHNGESHGWQLADGTYKAAQGVYPNFDYPEWQKVLNGTGKTSN